MNLETATIRHTVKSIQFGFFSDDDVRKRSVCEIKSPVTYDSLMNPLPNGMYTRELGPLHTSDGSCVTCGQMFQDCPGHCGHIELALPVYHPLLFPTVYRLLKSKCLHCHNFKRKNSIVRKHALKLELMRVGQIKRALTLDDELEARRSRAYSSIERIGDSGKKTRKIKKEAAAILSIDDVEQMKEKCIVEIESEIAGLAEVPLQAHSRTMYKELRKSIIADLVCTKCENCRYTSNKFRKDNLGKIFKSPLSLKAKETNKELKLKTVPSIELERKLKKAGMSIAEYSRRASGGGSALSRLINDENEEKIEFDQSEPSSNKADVLINQIEVRSEIRLTWALHEKFCRLVFGDGGVGYDVFFMNTVCVPPSRFRPPMMTGNMTVEHVQNDLFCRLMKANYEVRKLKAIGENRGVKAMPIDETMSGKTETEDLVKTSSDLVSEWMKIQNSIFLLCHDEAGGGGIRQILEKKQGMFRKNMMGKRVNYACRSVIAPDPYLKTNEIGLPRKFAKVLTLPSPVNSQNISHMRQLVINGTKTYPGCNWVEEILSENGITRNRRINLSRMDLLKRQALASRLVGNGTFVVGRQIVNGDRFLMNRQPTLHKPGIMAHVARIHNSDDQVLRMHYANCNTYNADFDGDEMNAHLVQSPLAQAEARLIMGAELQYISGTDGGVLRGLIQDHVDAGVKLTHPSTFLSRSQYQQFVYAALVDVLDDGEEIVCERGSIFMPKLGVELWTGKQVISTLLHHLTPKLYCMHKTKTSPALLGYGHDKVLIIDGEMLRGILDKNAFGSSSFGLVHSIHEAYGASAASTILSVLGRLFTFYLQSYDGHSCRMEDLILTTEANEGRRDLIQKTYNLGARSSLAFARSDAGKISITPVDELSVDKLTDEELIEGRQKLKRLLTGPEGAHNSAALDSHMQGVVNPLASKIIKACLPNGLECPFPRNTFGLMVNTGAKGSMVNQSQVSCCLGSQALEGRRVPRMPSGKTLPSFSPYCPTPRADGFISDRFLTGVRPQEYYFHCMAGREGLVDTAVKTSRSGYLQRCLVKHLEELKVCYDNTVRDAEGNVIQFVYGEDGIDPSKAAHLDPKPAILEYIARNYGSLQDRYKPLPNSDLELSSQIAQQAEVAKNLINLDIEDLKVGMLVQAKKLRIGNEWVRGALCQGWFDATITKIHSDGTISIRYNGCNEIAKRVPLEVVFDGCCSNRTLALWNSCKLIRIVAPDPILSGKATGSIATTSHFLGQSGACVSEKVAGSVIPALESDTDLERALSASNISEEDFRSLISAKYANSLIAPGEAVGSIAAQSVGEPSTQMTLNTFHLAGSGANLTLGIPRLREIIMTASKEIKTPTMSAPLLPHISEKAARRLARDYTKLTVKELIASHNGITVKEVLECDGGSNWNRSYYIKLKMHPAERIYDAFGLRLKDVAAVITRDMLPKIAKLMKAEVKKHADIGSSSFTISGGTASDFVDGMDDVNKNVVKKSKRKNYKDNDEYEDEEVNEEDGVMGDRFGHRQEMVSYGEMDDEDKQISKQKTDEENDNDSDDEDVNVVRTVTDDEEEFESFFNEKLTSNALNIDTKTNTFNLRPLKVDPSSRSFLMVGLVEKAAASTVVSSKSGITQAFINKEDGRGLCLQTAGINVHEMWEQSCLDHNRLSSNDIWAIRCTYGVEAARMTIVDQIRGVFAVYGISVDPRHLFLISDYMTYDGGYKAMNRLGMAADSSAFVQMSFETTAAFMTEAAVTSAKDNLESPSANIVLGKPIRHGTGAFDCLFKG